MRITRQMRGPTQPRNSVMASRLLALALGCCLGTTTLAQTKPPVAAPEPKLTQEAKRAITPVFSQLVSYSYPKGFTPAFEDTKETKYIQESVLAGETVQKWSQMITLTGVKNLAANPDLSPERFAGTMAGGFKRVCPESFSGAGLGGFKLGKHDAFVAAIGCGTVAAQGEAYSETAVVLVIKGEKDYYTLQWAERGKASKTPIPFDNNKWSERLKKLAPIKLCPLVPGEKAPFASCA